MRRPLVLLVALSPFLLASCSESIGPDKIEPQVLPALRIAATHSETGVWSTEGGQVSEGYRLAVEMLNESGGMGGRQVELVLRDDGSDPAAAGRIYGEFVADTTIDLLLGPFSSPISAAVIPVAEAAGHPFIASMAAAPVLWEGRNRQWTVQLLASARSYLRGPVELAAQEGIETVALVWEDSSFPNSVARGVREAALAAGMRVVLDKSYPPGDADHEGLAMAAKEAGAEIFLAGGYRADGIEFTKAVASVGYAPRLLSLVLGPADPGFLAETGELAECVAGYTPWTASLATEGSIADNATFVARYREAYGADPGYLSAGAFAAVELLAEAVESAADEAGQFARRAVRDYLFGTTAETVLGPYQVTPKGESGAGAQHGLRGLQVQWQRDADGQLALLVIYPESFADAEACFNAPDPGPIRVALTHSATGSRSHNASRMMQGYRLAVDMLNAEGGIDGRQVELVTADDGSAPNTAAVFYEQFLADTTIDALLGPYSSAVTEAVIPLAEAAQRPLITALASSTELWEGQSREWSVQMMTSGRTLLDGAVELAAEAGAKTVAVVWEDSRFPLSLAAGVREAAARNGLRVVLDRSYRVGRADHEALATAAKEARADLFVGGTYFDDAAGFVRSFDTAGYAPMLAAMSVGPADPSFLEAVGAAAKCVAGDAAWVPGVVTGGPIATSATFADRFRERHGIDPEYHSAAAFGAVELLSLALRESLQEDGRIDNAAMRDFLFATTAETVLGAYGVAPLGDPAAGVQRELKALQIQWQDDGEGGLVQRIIHPASAAEAEACIGPRPLRVAATYPATGYLRNDGIKMRNGYALGVEMLNEQGGVGGRMLELVMRDDRSDPEAAAQIYRQFVADPTIPLLLGPYGSVATEAVLDVTEDARRPLIAPMAASTELWAGQDRRWTVQMLNSAHSYLVGSVELAAKHGAETVALVWEDSRFPASVAEGVRAAAGREGMDVVVDQSYPAGGADHEALAAAARDAEADLFIGGGYLDDAVGLTKAARAVSYTPQLMSWNIGPADVHFASAEMAGDLARCVAGNTPWIPSIRTSGEIADSDTFVRRYQETFGNVEGYHAAGSFGAVELLAEGLRATITAEGEVDNEALRDYLFSASTETVLGPFGVAPLGEEAAGSQQLLTGLQVQWQEDEQGALAQKIIHPKSAANASVCFSR